MSMYFDEVFVVAEETDSHISKLCSQYENVHFLQRSTFLYKHASDLPIRVIGCTLWSSISEENSSHISNHANDYNKISIKDAQNHQIRKLKVQDVNRIHKQDVNWLTREIHEANEKGERVIIISHHAPLLTCINPALQHDKMNQTSATDLSSIVNSCKIDLWVYGHTHYTKVQVLNNTICASNQVGHKHEQEVGYKESQCFMFTQDSCQHIE
ncbi:hypothetical protein AKO1_014056 [Acrasis kona]|uniref:Calcineurin-like phosphoesterase domain-containing protein n=1 Tax=Acrasis kona TaxID=1008807 RepID=A0AAW2Z3B8_9EUKA